MAFLLQLQVESDKVMRGRIRKVSEKYQDPRAVYQDFQPRS